MHIICITISFLERTIITLFCLPGIFYHKTSAHVAPSCSAKTPASRGKSAKKQQNKAKKERCCKKSSGAYLEADLELLECGTTEPRPSHAYKRISTNISLFVT